jgi:hypothetical protein
MSQVIGIDAEVAHGPDCGCDYCREIKKLAPKLASPGWVWLMGIQADKPTLDIKELRATKKERVKVAKAKHKAHLRLTTILSGGRVRTRKAA